MSSESDQDEVRSIASTPRIPSGSSIIRLSRSGVRGKRRGYGRGRGSHGNAYDSSPASSSASTAARPLLIWSEKTFVVILVSHKNVIVDDWISVRFIFYERC